MADCHGEPQLGGAYRTNSLYLDTPELDVFLRSPWYRRRKFRIRSYASSSGLFLERKTRRGDRVSKRRSEVTHAELAHLTSPEPRPDWPAHWFHRRVHKRRLVPACLIAYQRTALVGSDPDEGLRLTLDRNLVGQMTDAWSLPLPEAGRPLIADRVILELKFRAALPALFKQMIGALQLTTSGVSKYRLCREAWQTPTAQATRSTAERRDA